MDALSEGMPVVYRGREMERDDSAAILYTSGATGKRKGATLSHGNVVSSSHATRHCVGSRPGDRHALFLPHFHGFGQNFVLNAALASGGTVLLQPRFDPDATPAAIREGDDPPVRRPLHLHLPAELAGTTGGPGRRVGGETCIRGPNVMLGYHGRPEESAEALQGGWFHSGDVGYRDADGYFYPVDRVKDMINAAGFKVWPREVEEVLYATPRRCGRALSSASRTR
jgi:acyl-CoA synthetase (AMP-forming)/AMP-acid ligase II